MHPSNRNIGLCTVQSNSRILAPWTPGSRLARSRRPSADGARASPRTRRWPTASGCSASTIGSLRAPRCPPSASWRRRSTLSRSTVAAAYRSLRDTGHIASTRGSGSVTLPLRRRDPGRAASGRGRDRSAAGEPAGLAGTGRRRWRRSPRPRRRSSRGSATTCSVAPNCARRSPSGTRERGIPTSPERGPRHDRRAERDPPRRLGAARAGRPGADRDADLPARRRRAPARRRAAGRRAGAHRRRLGSRPGRAGVRAHAAGAWRT